MRIVFYIVISALIIGSEVFAGQNQTEINAGSFIQKTSSKNIEYVQNDVQYSSFSVFADDLRNAMLKSATMKITDFPVSLNEKANLLLKRNRNIIDANTKFFTGGYNGDLPLKLPVIESYEGVIENVENSKVFLIITNGYLFCKIENENSNFILAPMNGGNFEQYVLVDEKTFYKNSPAIGTNCIADAIQEPLSRNLNKNTKLLSNDLLECELAIETDTEFFKAAGSDLNKATAYLTALFSFVSRLYEEQVRITFHLNFVKIWTNSPADPYDAKGDWQVLNNKVTAYWKDHYQNVERDLAHILTSISYGGGGFGYFDALCGKKDKGYAVTSLQGANNLLSFAFSYDIYIVAHEIGHNFNAQHTHSCFWGAPLDTCIAADAIQGGCLQAGTAPKPNPGSIMSYCGGTNNTAGLGWQVRLIFLPQNETLIRTTAEAANCITAPLSPMVKLTNPYNTESRQSGDTVLIEWRSARVSNIRLDYSADGGANWDSIADGLPSADEKYIWKTPDLCSRNVLIRISDADNEQVNNVLLKPFSIITPDFLVAYYPFNKNSKDEQYCHFYNAVDIGSPALTKDRKGKDSSAYHFNGANYFKTDKFNVPENGITAAFWFRVPDLTGTQQFLGTDWQEAWAFSVYFWGQFGASYYIDGKGAPNQIWGGGVSSNVWHHAAFTFDGRYSKLYLDGILKNTKDEGAGTHKINKWVDKPFYLGSRNGKDNLNGDLDNIKIYNLALTETEIVKLFNETEDVPGKTVLLLPQNNSLDVPVDADFSWTGVTHSSKYQINVGKDSTFTETDSTFISRETVQSQIQINGLKYDTEYFWRVRAYLPSSGYMDWSDIRSFRTVLFSEVNENPVTETARITIVPNPFNSDAILYLQVTKSGFYTITVMNSLGMRVSSVADNLQLNSGSYQFSIDLAKEASGIYFITLKNNNTIKTMKFGLVK